MTTWHASREVLARYASRPEEVDDLTAMSVEAHLLACADCRAGLSAAADPAALSLSWSAIADRIDQPQSTMAERLLRGLGVSAVNARLVGATRALRAQSLVTVGGMVAAMVAISLQSGTPGLFLVFAPIVPVAAVAATFAPGADPAGEAGAATPLAGIGLVLRRAAAVLTATLVVLCVGAVALPGLSFASAAWVLPALGLSLAALALATWVCVEMATVGVAAAWLIALSIAHRFQSGSPVADLTPLAAPGQLAALALAALAAAVLVARRDPFATLGGNL